MFGRRGRRIFLEASTVIRPEKAETPHDEDQIEGPKS